MLDIAIFIVFGFVIVLLVYDFRFMSAVQALDPALYELYGKHTIFIGVRKWWYLFAIILMAGYRDQISDPDVLALAERYRILLTSYFIFIFVLFVYVLASP